MGGFISIIGFIMVFVGFGYLAYDAWYDIPPAQQHGKQLGIYLIGGFVLFLYGIVWMILGGTAKAVANDLSTKEGQERFGKVLDVVDKELKRRGK